MLLKDVCPFFCKKNIEFLWFTHFWRKILSWEFTHFFRRFLWTEKQNPQTFLLFGCMRFVSFASIIKRSKVWKDKCKITKSTNPIGDPYDRDIWFDTWQNTSIRAGCGTGNIFLSFDSEMSSNFSALILKT